MDDKYSTLGRYGLASAYSYLDGVPFKIGPNFRPPSQVELPSELLRPNVHKTTEEYTFETEEAVLAWAKAREDALKQAAEEQAERQRQAEEAARMAEDTGESTEDDAEDAKEAVEANASSGVYDVPRNHHLSVHDIANANGKPPVPRKPVVAKPMSESNTILKPIPIQPASTTVANVDMDVTSASVSQPAKTSFDVSMFEQESDPFDNLELQTINDMEELKILLEPTTKPSAGDDVNCQSKPRKTARTNSTEDKTNANTTEGFYDLATVVTENNWVTFDDEKPLDSAAGTGDLVNGKFSSKSLGPVEGEYVEIDKKYNHNPQKNPAVNGYNGLEADTNGDHSTPLGGNLPTALANSKLYKPVLPPIPGMHKNQEHTSMPNISTSNNPFVQSINPFHSAVGNNPFKPPNAASSNPFLASTPDQAVTSDPSHGTVLYKAPVRVLPSPPPPVAKNPPPVAKKPPPVSRSQTEDGSTMWSSLEPSLAVSLDDSIMRPSPGRSNPYSRHSTSATDLNVRDEQSRRSPLLNTVSFPSTPMDSNPINRLRPLPPTPSPRSVPPVAAPRQNVENHSTSSPSGTKPTPLGLSDPYHSLSQEAQSFTDSLSSMGFLRARVARAVHKFGQDDREVLDHLLAVDKLVEKKYAPVMAELALHAYKNDIVKAEKFLEMQSQFEELGFKSECVRDALMTADMDHDKALDLLTA